MSPMKGTVDGCGTGIVLLVIVAIALAAGGLPANAETDEWDKSSINVTGECLADGRAQFVVANTGADMAGPSEWREYEVEVLASSGLFTLAAGGTQTWTFGPLFDVPIRFEADQRPEHPGNSRPRLTLTCERPTAVGLTAFTATSGAACWKGTVLAVYQRPGGWTIGVAPDRGGLLRWFWTARKFWVTQRVTVCGSVVK